MTHRPPPPPPAAAEDRSRPQQLALAFALGVVAALVGVKLCSGRAARQLAYQPGALPEYRIDLNRAPPGELAQLPRIGPATASSIVAGRPYGSVDDLDHVPGFGPATMDRVRPHVKVGPPAAPPSVASSPKAGKPAPRVPLDPNIASADELQTLPGIGPTIAQRIIDERRKRPFASVEELRRVSGVGAKTLAKVRPYVEIGNRTESDGGS